MKNENLYKNEWSEWKQFPNPNKKDYLCAPFGCGVYQLRNAKTGEYVLFGRSKHLAYRMCSLLTSGAGVRKNEKKQEYVAKHLKDIQYRTIALNSEEEARSFEAFVKKQEKYIFPETAKK